MGVQWYFRFEVKTADNRAKSLKYKASKQMQQDAHELLVAVYII